MKKVNTRKFCNFELGTQEGINIFYMDYCRFSTKRETDLEILNNDSCYRPPVTPAQCIIATESYPHAGKLLNYDDDNYSQDYGQIKKAFRALTKADILNP